MKKISKIYQQIEELSIHKAKLNQIEQILNTIKQFLPVLVGEIYSNPNIEFWREKIENLHRAWDWARVKSFLKEKLSGQDTKSLHEKLKNLDEERKKIIEELVYIKAWKACLDKITQETKKHLIAWEQAVKKIGKGKGKYASKYMRAAQGHLNKCRFSIPVWIMPVYKIYQTFQIDNPELFDVLIVDEASQCGLEILPLFQITKKVLIVGDDKQISPEVVGIEKSKIFQLIDEYLYDFQFKDNFDLETSIFDHAKRISPEVIILKEHFRCVPEIIDFSNRYFYNNLLIPLKQYSIERLPPIIPEYVDNAFCKGDIRPINPKEAEAIVEKIKEICVNEMYKGKTIGVISLLGDTQAKYTESLLIEQLDHKIISERQILCGDPYSFQGDERDVIFLSMVIAPINEDGSRRMLGVLNKLTDERRFNVAMSRAKEQIWLFHSVKIEELSRECLRRKLLEYFYKTEPEKIAGIDVNELEKVFNLSNRNSESPPAPFESWFEADVALELYKLGYHRITPQFKVGPYRIDLVVFDSINNRNRLAIECDGDRYHELDQLEKDLERQRILERCGWRFFRIRASEFYYDKKKVFEKLKSTLEKFEIYPQQRFYKSFTN
ncbi:AAA domain-containing protein [Caldisericum exile]|uniref:AAA domain-containing protein n=1 Tax=Caldisericum exile TaxID=693075 RepID=UPI003C744D8F